MNWREHVRILAIIANGWIALALIGMKAWWVSAGTGIPLIVPPALAVLALAVNRRPRGFQNQRSSGHDAGL